MKKFLYLLMVLVFLISWSNLASAQKKDSLVALYLFDEGSGGKVIDSSGKGNNGEIKGDGKWVNGKVKGGLKFNGKDTFVEIPNSDSLNLANGLTIAMWIYLNNYSTAGGTGVTKETTYKVGTRDNKKIEIRIAPIGGDWAAAFVYGNTDVPLQEWHHIAATYDSASGQAYIYLDGKEDGAGKFSGKIITTTNVVWIGRGAAPFFDGIYDEVSVWNTVLSKDEIIQASLSLSAVEFHGKLSSTWGRIKLE